MGISHVPCMVRYPGYEAPGAWTPTTLENLPYRGFEEGERVCRPDNPQVGILEHICYEEHEYTGRRWYYAYVLWPNGHRRGDKVFDTHGHVYLFNLRHATNQNIAAAEAIAAAKLHQQALRLGLVRPVD